MALSGPLFLMAFWPTFSYGRPLRSDRGVRAHAGRHGLALRLARAHCPELHEEANGRVGNGVTARCRRRWRRVHRVPGRSQRDEAQTDEGLGIGSEAGIHERGPGRAAVRSDDGALVFVLHEDGVRSTECGTKLKPLIRVDSARPVYIGEGLQADVRQADFSWVLKVTAGATARQGGGHLDVELLVRRRSSILRLCRAFALSQHH